MDSRIAREMLSDIISSRDDIEIGAEGAAFCVSCRESKHLNKCFLYRGARNEYICFDCALSVVPLMAAKLTMLEDFAHKRSDTNARLADAINQLVEKIKNGTK